MVGAAAAAEDGELRQALSQRDVLERKLLGVPDVELLRLVELGVRKARRVRSETHDAVCPAGARLEHAVEMRRVRAVDHEVGRVPVRADVDLLDRCLAVNVRAPLLLCKFALPGMVARGSGSIFCITSGAARGYRPGRVGYSMSKAALERMFLSLAEEVRPYDIAVNVLSPGRVDTWMNRRGDWPGTSHIPMEQPEAIIPAATWLATQDASSFSGHVVERADFGVTWGPGVAVAAEGGRA